MSLGTLQDYENVILSFKKQQYYEGRVNMKDIDYEYNVKTK